MNRNLFIFNVLFCVFAINLQAQESELGKVEWMPFEKAYDAYQTKQKPIFIVLHNDKSPQSVDFLNQTLSNPEVTNYINVLMYPILINQETKEDITFFDGKVYKKTNKLYHDIAYLLFGDTLRFPSFLIFDKNGQGQAYSGNFSRDSIFPPLIYNVEDMPKSVTYDVFEKYYYKTYPPGKSQTVSRVLVKWKTFEELDSLMKVKPKKVFIDIYNNYKISATMMRLQTYNNPLIARYLNEHFYPITLNAFDKNKIEFLNQTFVNEALSHKYHQLSIALLGGKMIFPAFVIFDENLKIIEKQQLFFGPKQFEPFIKYYGSGKYKTSTQADFMKNFKSELPEDD